jgi:hypothetical protein
VVLVERVARIKESTRRALIGQIPLRVNIVAKMTENKAVSVFCPIGFSKLKRNKI